jgi:Raf kinase inhibitor-like YbhB/YbcL family protein
MLVNWKLLGLSAFLVGGACKATGGGGVPSPPPGVAVASITVTSSTLPGSAPVPIDFTCDGKDQMPALTWSAPPENTRSLAVVVDDLDAPGGIFTHYIAFNISPELRQIKEGSDPAELGARVGTNDFNNARYNGPCPPKGDDHRYRFTVMALNAVLTLPDGVTRATLDNAMAGHLLGQGELDTHFGH